MRRCIDKKEGLYHLEVEPVSVYVLKAMSRIGRVSGFEFCAGDAALPDDRKECTDGELRVVRNRDCDRPCVGSTLHYHMTAASPDLVEAVFFKNLAGVSAGKNSQFTHALLRSV